MGTHSTLLPAHLLLGALKPCLERGVLGCRRHQLLDHVGAHKLRGATSRAHHTAPTGCACAGIGVRIRRVVVPRVLPGAAVHLPRCPCGRAGRRPHVGCAGAGDAAAAVTADTGWARAVCACTRQLQLKQ